MMTEDHQITCNREVGKGTVWFQLYMSTSTDGDSTLLAYEMAPRLCYYFPLILYNVLCIPKWEGNFLLEDKKKS